MPTTDLGAAGTVTAESFAVEIEKNDGSTIVTKSRYVSFDAADQRADEINQGIEDGSIYWEWTQAYVVTADGSEV